MELDLDQNLVVDSPFCSEAQRSEEEEVLFMSPLKEKKHPK